MNRRNTVEMFSKVTERQTPFGRTEQCEAKSLNPDHPVPATVVYLSG